MPKYPNITVPLVGEDGNAFFIIGRMRQALKAAKVPHDEVEAFTNEAMSGDYSHLIATCVEWVEVE